MFGTFDSQGRLFVAESSGLDLYAELQKLTRKCRISLLEDRDGDGRFETSTVFADQLVFPMGLTWHDGRLYVADPPSVIALEDTNGDGKADKRTHILGEFGHQDNGSLHGLLFGPDGWLYMTMGQPDGYRFKKPDGSWIEGKTGALIRCKPDGSDVEVVCRGFENLVELDFMPTGEMIGTDNWFTLPEAGVRDALVHLVDGGLYPLAATHRGSPMLISGPPLPAISSYPAVALSGFTRGRGHALRGADNNLFYSAQHNTRKVMLHRLIRSGATFRSEDSDFLSTEDPDFHPSDVLEDADGSLLVIDTGSWYIHHCPTGRIRKTPSEGGVYRVREMKPSPISNRRFVPVEWSSVGSDILAQRLVDPRESVRLHAVAELARRGRPSLNVLAPMLEDSRVTIAVEMAAWALGRIEGGEFILQRQLESSKIEHALLAARILGRLAHRPSAPALARLLSAPELALRFAASEALARCGNSNQVRDAATALSVAEDRFLIHSLIHFLHLHASRETLEVMLNDPRPGIQRAALILLDQHPHFALRAEQAVQRLFHKDNELRRAARDALLKHKDWIDAVLPMLRRLSENTQPTSEELEWIVELVSTFRAAPAFGQWLEASLAGDPPASIPIQCCLLQGISRVAGSEIPPGWINAIARSLRSESKLVVQQALRTARSLKLESLDPELSRLALDSKNPPSLRLQAMAAIRIPMQATLAEMTEMLLEQCRPVHPVQTRIEAAELLGQSALSEPALARFLELARSDRVIPPSLIFAAARKSFKPGRFNPEFLRFAEHWVEQGGALEPSVLEWLESASGISGRESRIRTQLNARSERQVALIQELEPLLKDGDYNRGQELFLGKATCAACHRIGMQGGISGPDLTKIGAIRSGRDLLESLVMPSSSFAQGYEPYHVSLKSGEMLTGIRVRGPEETFILRDASGRDTRLGPGEIQAVQRGTVSLMPEGLLAALTREEIRDLLAYLMTLK